MSPEEIIVANAIDASPLNRGLSGEAWLATPGNIYVIDEAGNVALLDAEGEDEYQIHVLCVERGNQARDFILSVFQHMFEDRGAELIFGLVPDFRRDVKCMARLTGMKFVNTHMTEHGSCDLFVLPKKGDE